MKKFLLTLSVLAAATTASIGQIHYHDITPDTSTAMTMSAWKLAPFGSPTGSGEDMVLWYYTAPNKVLVQTHGDFQVLFKSANSLPAKLGVSDSVSASGAWSTCNYDLLSDGASGNWATSAADKYLGFRAKKNGAWQYGWLKITIEQSPLKYTVKEWAMRTTPGRSIKAGQINTTSIDDNERAELRIGMINENKKLRFANLVDNVKYEVVISDNGGRLLHRAAISKNDELDMRALSAGIYIIQLQGGGMVHAFRTSL